MREQSNKWHKIFATDMTGKSLISKIYKQLAQHNIKKKKPQNGQITWKDIFSKEDIQMANKRMIRGSPPAVIREVHIKTTGRNHFILVAIIKKSANNKSWQWCGQKGTTVHSWDYKLEHPVWKIIYRYLKTVKIELSYDPAIPLLSTYLK